MPFTQHLNKLESYQTEDIHFCLKLEWFLHNSGINTYKLIKIETDASKRCYYRILTSEQSYILMDSSQEPESLSAFLNVAYFLLKNRVKAPAIYAQDVKAGFLLLEDFGNDSYTKYLENNAKLEEELYLRAIEVLINIAKLDTDITLPIQNDELLNNGISVFIEFYISHKLESKHALSASKEIFNTFNKLYKLLSRLPLVLTLRDYHADNLMWIEYQSGIERVGLLDFQDAVLGFPTYDLVSLLEDARRDVSSGIVFICKEKYFSSFDNISRSDLELAYAILSAQRNLRIVGAFHRLNIKYNKPKYLKYLPRVWKYVKENLHHPQLHDLKVIFDRYDLYEF